LMRRSVAVDERQRHVDALLRSARMLTAQIGGKCP
jgi:hypothetical protein